MEKSSKMLAAGITVYQRIGELIKKIVGYQGSIVRDRSKPDGTPRKLMDVSKLKAQGWQTKVPLIQGMEMECQRQFLKIPVE